MKFDTTNNKCKKYKIHILQQHQNSVKCQNFTALHNLIKIYLNSLYILGKGLKSVDIFFQCLWFCIWKLIFQKQLPMPGQIHMTDTLTLEVQ